VPNPPPRFLPVPRKSLHKKNNENESSEWSLINAENNQAPCTDHLPKYRHLLKDFSIVSVNVFKYFPSIIFIKELHLFFLSQKNDSNDKVRQKVNTNTPSDNPEDNNLPEKWNTVSSEPIKSLCLCYPQLLLYSITDGCLQ